MKKSKKDTGRINLLFSQLMGRPQRRAIEDTFPWYWDKDRGRYRERSSGRFVAWATVKEKIELSIKLSTDVSDRLAQYVSSGQISVGNWESLFRSELKGEVIRQYLAGAGGWGQMTQADWGRVGAILKDQFSYIPGFAQDIADGKLNEEQIRARSAMYFNSAREAYNRSQFRVAVNLGFDEVAWILYPEANHCDDCLDFSLLGFVPIDSDPFRGAIPGNGYTRCLTACKCTLLYRNSKTGAEYGG